MATLERLTLRDGHPPPSLRERLRLAWRGFTSWAPSTWSGGEAAFWASPVSSSGLSGGASQALTLGSVFSAVSLIAGHVASLPCFVYNQEQRLTQHPLAGLLHDAVNSECSAQSWRQSMMVSALLHGNGYSEIVRGADGRPAALYFLTPDRVQLQRERGTGALLYKVANTDSPDAFLGTS